MSARAQAPLTYVRQHASQPIKRGCPGLVRDDSDHGTRVGAMLRPSMLPRTTGRQYAAPISQASGITALPHFIACGFYIRQSRGQQAVSGDLLTVPLHWARDQS